MPRSPSAPVRFSAGKFFVRVLGLVCGVTGALWAFSGGAFFLNGGSPYYLVFGLGLLISGYFFWRQSPFGVLSYLAAFTFAVIWTYAEARVSGWPPAPRLAGPALLLLLVLSTIPTLLPNTEGHRLALGSLTACALMVAFGNGAMALSHQRSERVASSVYARNFKAIDDGVMRVAPALQDSVIMWKASAARPSPLSQVCVQSVREKMRAECAARRFYTGGFNAGGRAPAVQSPRTAQADQLPRAGSGIYALR